MFRTEIKIRVRYSETDRMGYCYYGNYASYFEVARVEALRSFGMAYKTLEDGGIMLPVSHYEINYLQPAFYDDMLTIKVEMKMLSPVKLHFQYETFNESLARLNVASTTLVFVDAASRRPIKAPDNFLELMASSNSE